MREWELVAAFIEASATSSHSIVNCPCEFALEVFESLADMAELPGAVVDRSRAADADTGTASSPDLP